MAAARRGDATETRACRFRGGALTIAALGIVVASAGSGGRIASSFARFDDLSTDRPEMWEDTIYAAGIYWPAGSGMGTFDEVFEMHESLEYVSPRTAGRAHNDWIELALESGLVGLALAIFWLGWCAQSALRGRDPHMAWLRPGAGLGIAMIAAQSGIDYPLRTQTLLCYAALLVVLLARQREVRA